LWFGLFNARGIEDHRWRIAATSLRFDSSRWPLPAFGVREPFARRWSLRILDETTLATVATHAAAEREAQSLPDARIFEPEHLERLLDALLDGDGTSQVPLVVVDVHPPLDPERLNDSPAHARVQAGEPLATRDTAILSAFLNARDDVSLRLYGSTDRATLLEIVWLAPSLRRLEIDVPLDTLALLYPLEQLEDLAVRHARETELPQPERFRALRSLTLRGTLEHDRLIAQLPALRRLTLQAADWETATPLHGAAHLHEVQFADMPLHDVAALGTLPALRSLALRRCDLTSLGALRGMPLESLAIDGLRSLNDLTVLRELPQLRTLSVRNMPHLNVHDFRFLSECASLQALRVDLGSRSKNREIYRAAYLTVAGSTASKRRPGL